MLDVPVLRAHAWRTWHVFAYAFVVYLAGIVAIVHHGSVIDLGRGTLFVVALLAAVAVAGVGYQEVRDSGHYARRQGSDAGDDWSI